ncbi:MAG: HAMP domain-containing histidine kinase [Bacteroidetes bacterium]|nr:HAMP domain-containing histidine kinase [Bacteroidota bacterium]
MSEIKKWLGTTQGTFEERMDHFILSLIAVSGIGICLLYLVYTIPAGYYEYSILNIITAGFCLVAYLFNRANRFDLAFWFFFLSLPAIMVCYVYFYRFGNAHMYLVAGAVFCSLLSTIKKRWNDLVWAYTLGLMLICRYLMYNTEEMAQLGEVERLLYFPNAIFAFFLVYLVSRFYNIRQANRRDKLSKMNSVKERILSVVSHDLRAPLGSLSGLIKLNEQNVLDQKVFAKHLNKLGQQVDLTSGMLDNLLFWSKTQLEGIKPNIDWVDFNKTIEQTIALYQLLIDKKQVSIITQFDGHYLVESDAEMLKIIVRNLASNAVKYVASTKGEIRFLLAEINNELKLTISDNGVGMGPDKLQRLFKKQVTSSKGTEDEHGFGLGLTLVGEFAAQLGISLSAESEIGKGTEVVVGFKKGSYRLS